MNRSALRFGKLFTLFFAMMLGGQTFAGVIVVTGDSNLDYLNPQLPIFYSNMFGGQNVFASPSSGFFVGNTETQMAAAAGSFTRGTLTSGSLAGMDWFVGGGDGAFSAAQIAEIVAFFNGGGNVYLIGDAEQDYAAQDATINAVLAALGSSMSLAGDGAPSTWTATGASIGADPLTSGITAFGGNYSSIVSGGTALFRNNANGDALLAVERGGVPVPEPGTLALLAVGFASAGFTSRRRRKANDGKPPLWRRRYRHV